MKLFNNSFLFSVLIFFVQLVTAIIGSFSICTWMVYKWTIRQFGSTLNFDQILWTLSYSTEGADPKLIKSAYLNVCLGIVFCIIWILLTFYFNHYSKFKSHCKQLLSIFNALLRFIVKIVIFVKHLRFYSVFYAIVGLVLLFSVASFSLVSGLRLLDKNYHVMAYYENQKIGEKYDYYDQYYSVPSISEVHFRDKKNLVLVMGESLESNFNSTVPLSSQLDKLAANGKSVKDMINSTGSTWTIGALTGWHFGLPLKLPVGGNEYYSKKGFLPNALSVFDILKANRYKMVLMLGSNKAFSGKDSLFETHGNFEIYDIFYWMKHGWDLKKYQGSDWGYSDEFVFERAREKYLELQKEGNPFVLIVETVDTHMTDGWCPKNKRIFNDIRDAYLESDRQISSFISFIQNNQNSSLITGVIGDHLFMGEPICFKNIKRNIRNVFWGDLPDIPEEKKDQIICPVDVAPTILQAAGAEWKSSKFGLGTSIFSKDESLIQKLGPSLYNKYFSSPSKKYQSFY